MEILTDEQLVAMINQLKDVNVHLPVLPGTLTAFQFLEILASEHLYLRKKFRILENSFVDFCAEKRDTLGEEKAVMD